VYVTFYSIYLSIDHRCYRNGCATRGTILGVAAVTGGSFLTLDTFVRPHGTLPLLVGHSSKTIGVCYCNYTIQAIRCDDCMSKTTLTTDSKFAVKKKLTIRLGLHIRCFIEIQYLFFS